MLPPPHPPPHRIFACCWCRSGRRTARSGLAALRCVPADRCLHHGRTVLLAVQAGCRRRSTRPSATAARFRCRRCRRPPRSRGTSCAQVTPLWAPSWREGAGGRGRGRDARSAGCRLEGRGSLPVTKVTGGQSICFRAPRSCRRTGCLDLMQSIRQSINQPPAAAHGAACSWRPMFAGDTLGRLGGKRCCTTLARHAAVPCRAARPCNAV
eukprot:353105-Chlamydomonas_euryale.AAC.1